MKVRSLCVLSVLMVMVGACATTTATKPVKEFKFSDEAYKQELIGLEACTPINESFTVLDFSGTFDPKEIEVEYPEASVEVQYACGSSFDIGTICVHVVRTCSSTGAVAAR